MKYAIMLAATFKIHLIIMALTAILSGCGSDQGDDSAASTSPESDKLAEGKASSLGSIRLQAKDDLPECTEENNTQLAYIIDDEAFYVCEALEWVEAEIKGKDGQKGQDGSDGQDASLSNSWVDPVTGYEWMIGGYGTWTGSYCATGYQRPDVWIAGDAIAHGLITASLSISGPNNIWTINHDVASNQGQYLDVNGTWVYAAKTSAKGIFCYKQ